MSSRPSAEPPRVRLTNINKSFRRAGGQSFNAIDGVSIDVAAGEFLVLLGPSGCGKTTLLRSVAGLEQPDSGRIELNGEPVFDAVNGLDVPPEKRRIGMVFQSYALWPHMTVMQNVTYPLRMRGVPAQEAKERAQRMLRSVNIPDLADQHPSRISGGQQQRVALARALVSGDQVVLFDEPLSNVDAKVREHLRTELLTMQRALRFTAIYVTHDQDEALALATNIAVMQSGKIVQLGSPQTIYRRPASLYVGTFLGSANVIPGRLKRDSSGASLETSHGALRVLPENIASTHEDVVALSRPERWTIGTNLAPPHKQSWIGQIKSAAFLGSRTEYLVAMNDFDLKVATSGEELLPIGSTVWCATEESAWTVVDRE